MIPGVNCFLMFSLDTKFGLRKCRGINAQHEP